MFMGFVVQMCFKMIGLRNMIVARINFVFQMTCLTNTSIKWFCVD